MDIENIIKLFSELLRYDSDHIARVGDHLLIIISGLYLLFNAQQLAESFDTLIIYYVITIIIIFVSWMFCYYIVSKFNVSEQTRH